MADADPWTQLGLIDNSKDVFRRTAAGFGDLVHQVGDDQWKDPTPCTDWNVRDLVAHLVYESLWAPDILAGKTIAEVGDAYEGNILGTDPVNAWDEASARAVDAVAGADLDATAHLSFGDVPGAEFVAQLLSDYLIHSWDLAQAIGARCEFPADITNACLAWFKPREAMARGAGIIGAQPPIAEDADAQTELLARYGRAG